MITCRELFNLDSFKGVQLLGGEAGLDNVITWPYAKHTKVISPWVQGGEFVLVSGYELGVNEEELLQLIREAQLNKLSGLLIEGGINFKSLGPLVIQAADDAALPLFFAARVVSFLDITREISSLILESQMIDRYNASLLEKALYNSSSSRQELEPLFERYGIPADCQYQILHFALQKRGAPEEGVNDDTQNLNSLKAIQATCSMVLQKFGLKAVTLLAINALSYLTYGKSEKDLDTVSNAIRQVLPQFSGIRKGYGVTLASSEVIEDITGIQKGFSQAVYTSSLMGKGILSGTTNSFRNIGSYQFLFYMEDKGFLLRFRDQYLKQLYDCDRNRTSQLVETLRVYLTHGGNMLRTANALYIHRNTLQYRLERISQITGKNLNDMETRQDFSNALMILNIYPFITPEL